MKTINGSRYIPFITLSLSEPKQRIWITLSGCNFNCKGCFSGARDTVGVPMTVDGLINWVEKSSRTYKDNIGPLEEAIITGGEPTLDKDFLRDLVLNLKMRVGVKHITLSTNGFLLDREFVNDLKDLGLNEVKLDLKAYNDAIHKWYTGMSNRPVLKAVRNLYNGKLDFRVETVLMPKIVDVAEIEQIASFLALIDPKIKYKVVKFAPGEAREKVTRRPSDVEIQLAVNSASTYLLNVAGGKACVHAATEPRAEGTKKWVRVYPDMKTETIIAKPGGFEVS
ncbi:pyruvate formate lyase activating enzyme [Methanophagales archaeon]|nr:pyruvate formate lyase activating enzyme [Methanophagales archaeon]